MACAIKQTTLTHNQRPHRCFYAELSWKDDVMHNNTDSSLKDARLALQLLMPNYRLENSDDLQPMHVLHHSTITAERRQKQPDLRSSEVPLATRK